MSKGKVVVGLSGGVDSSVAAYLLKEQGYEVIGMYMQNWHDTTGTLEGDCPWNDDLMIAEMVAKKLDIPFIFIDLSDTYTDRVVSYMFSEYERGRTPNPDVLCNSEIKFEAFLKAALDQGADYLATGHYCRKDTIDVDGKPTYRLLAGSDPNKDQSYFLCQLSQEQLSKALFPIGHLLKPEVRRIAAEQDLPTAEKKDSQGLCFVGKIDLPVFLQQKLAAKPGITVEIDPAFYDKLPQRTTLQEMARPYFYHPNNGKKVGTHNGAHFFTIGQRKGINVGGKALPLFVIAIDVENNTLYVGQGHEHPGLNRKGLFIKEAEIHAIRPDLAMSVGEERRYKVRIRYRQPLQDATLYRTQEGLYIIFDTPQRGITAGQFAAWYDNEELVGSGVIFE
ncbi:tRNA 2-thiouridine(34) synthase MnmA [Acetobacteroides hydrogenigenes]|uniref:tRNA-specific 2-thiouridylase MnmA n=1 Tax=Acetobacteroides hydrogenigenes TaxID=979970 RepID=A0A4R2EMA1_9BACT|nr:tRNA 2-thiouridine(34) synthase MnmA [Acetobacteroides hydrogenigenes]TCN68516.1 tRNA-specific 2-thiouridylase [Acetobacteroides hydrogenigenes]